MKDLFLRWGAGRPKSDWLAYIGLGLLAVGLLLFTMYQFKKFGHGVEEMNDLPGYYSFHRFEQVPASAGQTAFYYSWTRPASTAPGAPPISALRLTKIPRNVPLYLTLEMSLARPAGVAPARVEVNLLDDDGNFLSQLAVYDFDPNQPGFNKYIVVLPSTTEDDEGANIQIKSNSFTIKGDARELGVRLRGFEIETKASRYGRYIWPQPFIPATFVLFFGILIWAWRVRLGWFELAFTLLPLSLVGGTMSAYLRPYSWLALLCAVVVVGSSWLWQRESLPLIGRLKRRAEIGPILLATAAIIGFFLYSLSYPDDVNYHHLWSRDVHNYGPFNIYNNSPSLNYLPMAPYFFWVYSWIAYPLGLQGNTPFLKAIVSLALLVMVYVVWRFARRKGQSFSSEQLGATLVMFCFNSAILYNPVIWGQIDAGLALLLLLSFTLLYAGRRYSGILAGSGALIFKPQAIFALPLIGLIALRREGFKRSLPAALVGLGSAFIAGAAAFGFSWDSFVNQFWLQGQLAGDNLDFSGVRAYNLPHILNYTTTRSQVVVLVGFAIIVAVYGLLAALTWFKGAHERDTSLAIALAIMVCFIFAIKMHERYPFYALPFMGLATLYDRRASKPWLLLSLISLGQLIISRIPTRRFLQVPDNFYLWNKLVQDSWDWLPYALSWATIAVFVYMLGFYLWRFVVKEKAPAASLGDDSQLVGATSSQG